MLMILNTHSNPEYMPTPTPVDTRHTLFQQKQTSTQCLRTSRQNLNKDIHSHTHTHTHTDTHTDTHLIHAFTRATSETIVFFIILFHCVCLLSHILFPSEHSCVIG